MLGVLLNSVSIARTQQSAWNFSFLIASLHGLRRGVRHAGCITGSDLVAH